MRSPYAAQGQFKRCLQVGGVDLPLLGDAFYSCVLFGYAPFFEGNGRKFDYKSQGQQADGSHGREVQICP